MENIKNTLAPQNISLIRALELLKLNGNKCLIIVNQNKKLLGTLTDGDIRKLIISGKKLSTSIKKFYNKNPKYFFFKSYSIEQLKNEFLRNKYDLIPLVDKKKRIKNIISWEEVFKNEELKKKKKKIDGIKLVIIAGGYGTRLIPFTTILPKPLIPINDKSVLEHILENFYSYGINETFISLNFKSKTIKAYCEELKAKYNLKYVIEDKPLGTVGSIKLIKKNLGNKPFFVTNADIIINSDLEDIYDFHQKKKNDVTIIVAAKKFTIPYGICTTNKKGLVIKIQEKPFQELLVNTGMYVLNPDIIKLFPSNRSYDFTDLFKDLKKRNKKIGFFPVADNSWIDVGEWGEYKKSLEKFKI